MQKETVFPRISYEMGNARVCSDGESFVISTGIIERRWGWAGTGLRTIGLNHLESGKKWSCSPGNSADWDIDPVYGPAVLEDIAVTENDDEGLTGVHLQVDVRLCYPESGHQLIYRIWCYPDAPGIRTQLLIWGEGREKKALRAGIVVRQGWKEKSGPFAGFLRGIKIIGLQLEGLLQEERYVLGIRFPANEDGTSPDFTLQTLDRSKKAVYTDSGILPGPECGSPLQQVSFQLDSDLFSEGSCELIMTQSGTQVFANLFDLVLLKERSSGEGCIVDGWDIPPQYECAACLADARLSAKMPVPDRNTVEQIPVQTEHAAAAFAGYYSDTQKRNMPETKLLRETEFTAPSNLENSWASLMTLQDQNGNGLIAVKESHKCVNTPDGGANSGGFLVGADGISVTGAGWLPGDLQQNTCHACWATWLILYAGGPDHCAFALKQFDRIRYPVDPDYDVYMMANTWGSDRLQEASVEENVIKELAVQQELGIDVQQIDDGWEGLNYITWMPAREMVWKGETVPVYPDGWVPVKNEAARRNMSLGLWTSSSVSAEDILRNWREGGFRYFKFDFGNFETMAQMARVDALWRHVFRQTGRSVRVNWDVTESSPRCGYFWGREYGSVFLENRSATPGDCCLYQPWLVLRDAWHLSKYLNLNQIQVPVQNGRRIHPDAGDASLHSPAYLLAQTLMALPLFFQETQFYNDEDRAVLKPLIALYKEHRHAIAREFVFPVGEEPDNSSWSGFQSISEGRDRGYILLFRQIKNEESEKKISLKFVSGECIQMRNLINQKTLCRSVGPAGEVLFEIPTAPDFLFYRYEMTDAD